MTNVKDTIETIKAATCLLLSTAYADDVLDDREVIVKNFFGERAPRILKLKSDVTAKVEGSEIIIESTNKEIAGQVAADIEQLTRITNKDKRIFQDGIYITEKDGKKIE